MTLQSLSVSNLLTNTNKQHPFPPPQNSNPSTTNPPSAGIGHYSNPSCLNLDPECTSFTPSGSKYSTQPAFRMLAFFWIPQGMTPSTFSQDTLRCPSGNISSWGSPSLESILELYSHFALCIWQFVDAFRVRCLPTSCCV